MTPQRGRRSCVYCSGEAMVDTRSSAALNVDAALLRRGLYCSAPSRRVSMRWLAILLLSSVALAASSTSRAHHSSSGYDTNRTVTVRGTVVRYEWSNPHVYIYIR